jgi:hypothetical protein
MAFSTRREWSPEYTGHNERRNAGPYRTPLSTLTFHTGRSWAQLQPGEKKLTQEAEDEDRIEVPRPSNGRATVLGRRMERPADIKPAGPSGQRDVAQHNRTHTNK